MHLHQNLRCQHHSIDEVWMLKASCEKSVQGVCVDISGKDMRQFKCSDGVIVSDADGERAVSLANTDREVDQASRETRLERIKNACADATGLLQDMCREMAR